MLELIRPEINIDFLRLWRYAIAFSVALTVLGLGSIAAKGGLSYGIDFTGGLLLHVRVDDSVRSSEIRDAVGDLDTGDIQVQAFESQKGEYLLRAQEADDELSGGTADRIKSRLRDVFGQRGFEELRTEMVGPRVGRDLRTRALLSVLFATVAMGAYIALRFDARFGIGAAVALFHDILVALTAVSLCNIEVDLTVVAALLTIIGYSVNDTVIVSDRIRENMKLSKKQDLDHIINRSINETLSRTILTSGTTLLVSTALALFGGPVIYGFAFTLLVGITTGTYSSIFIASPVVSWWERHASGSK